MKQAFKTLTICFLLTLISCRGDDIIFIPEKVPVTSPEEDSVTSPEEDSVTSPEYTSIKGFYLLNEGNMGSNKATLDYYDYTTGVYTRNIYGNANPDVPKEMGDVGNDLKILYNSNNIISEQVKLLKEKKLNGFGLFRYDFIFNSNMMNKTTEQELNNLKNPDSLK